MSLVELVFGLEQEKMMMMLPLKLSVSLLNVLHDFATVV